MHVVINGQKGSLAVVSLVDGKIEVSSQIEVLKHDLMERSYPYQGGKISAKDGLEFLKALPTLFSGDRVRATLVEHD